MDKTTLEAMINKGYSTREIARQTTTSQSNVRVWLKKYDLKTQPNKPFKCKECGEQDKDKAAKKGKDGRHKTLCSACLYDRFKPKAAMVLIKSQINQTLKLMDIHQLNSHVMLGAEGDEWQRLRDATHKALKAVDAWWIYRCENDKETKKQRREYDKKYKNSN